MTRFFKMRNILLSLIICTILLITILPLDLYANDAEPSSGSTENTARGAVRGNYTRSGVPGLPNDQWPGFLGGSARTGNTTATGLHRYHLIWSSNLGIVHSSAVVMYDRIFVGSSSGLRCLNMSGGVVWTFNTGTRYSTPLVFNGNVYYAAGNGNLYCFNANASGPTATPIWTYIPAGATAAASSPVTDGTKIYYNVKHTSGLHAVWLSNGSKAWNASLGGSTVTESSPSYWNGRIYSGGGASSLGVGTNDLYCFNSTNGNLSWNFTVGDQIVSTPAVEYGRVYFGCMDGKVYCVDAIGGNGTTTKHWEYSVGNTDVFASVAVAYGRAYIGDYGHKLHCLNALATGGTTTQYWNHTLTPTSIYGICSSVAITSEYIYVGSGSFTIHCRNRTTGQHVWSESYQRGTGQYGIASSPAVYEDKIVVTADNGNLYFLGPDIKPPKIVSTDPVDEEIYVDPYENISIVFDGDVLISTLTTSNVVLKDSGDNTVAGTVTSDMGIDTAYFTPTSALDKDENYTLTIYTGVTDAWDNSLDGNKNGVSDGVGIDEYEISFSTVPFYPPMITQIGTLRPTEDIQMVKNVSSYISDVDTDKNDLILALNSPSSYVTLNGFDLHLLYPNGVTVDSINLSVSDNFFTKYVIIDVEVKAVNDPPVIAPISPLSLTEDVTYSLNMATYLTDIDTPFSALSMWAESTEYTKKYFDKDGWYLNFTYPEGITSDVVNVTIYEGKFDSQYKDAIDIEITVTPVNDAPQLDSPISEIRIDEDTTDTSIDLDKWFKDVDDTLLTYSAAGNENTEVTIASNGAVTIEPEPDWCGTEIVTITAKDPNLKQVSTNLTVIIEAMNDPPIIIDIIKPVDKITIEYNETIDLEAEVDDKDLPYGDTLEYFWYDDENGFLADTLTAEDILLTPGEHIIEFTVRDENNTEVMKAITVTMKPNPVIVKPDDKPKPKPNGTDGGDGGDGVDPKDSSTNEEFMSSGLLIGIVLIVIIIIVVLAVLALTMKKKKEKAKKQTAEASPELIAQQQPPMPMTMAEQSLMQTGMQQNMTMMQQFPPQEQYPDQTTGYDQSQYPPQDMPMTMAEQQQYSQLSETPQQYEQIPEQSEQFPQLTEGGQEQYTSETDPTLQETEFEEEIPIQEEKKNSLEAIDPNDPLLKASFFSPLSDKSKNNETVVVDSISIPEPVEISDENVFNPGKPPEQDKNKKIEDSE